MCKPIHSKFTSVACVPLDTYIYISTLTALCLHYSFFSLSFFFAQSSMSLISFTFVSVEFRNWRQGQQHVTCISSIGSYICSFGKFAQQFSAYLFRTTQTHTKKNPSILYNHVHSIWMFHFVNSINVPPCVSLSSQHRLNTINMMNEFLTILKIV